MVHLKVKIEMHHVDSYSLGLPRLPRLCGYDQAETCLDQTKLLRPSRGWAYNLGSWNGKTNIN